MRDEISTSKIVERRETQRLSSARLLQLPLDCSGQMKRTKGLTSSSVLYDHMRTSDIRW
jgi:hypothetical protein